jgi:small basic protein
MKIFGKSLSDYVRFERGFLILVLLVGLARLVLSLLGVPNSTAKFLSLTVLFLLGMVYYSVRVYTSGFGSYKQLLPALALPVILGNCIIIAGIVLAILTGKDNIFSAPEFSPGKVDGKTWGHAASHVVVMIVLPLILWAVGSLIMFVSKKLTGGREQRGGVVG